ncbi:MAG: Hsp20/alpha crystallin family protein [Henriciella sp.]|nr:Hsp20/alpha crystallin family protein [Henriciella sp.]
MTTPRKTDQHDSRLLANPFAAMRQDIDSIFNRYLPSMFHHNQAQQDWSFINADLDLSETDDSLELEIDAPGIDKKDIDISLNGQTLSVSGTREDKREEKAKDFHQIERSFGSFQRQITLPCEVDTSKIEASLKDGVLKIVMPKTEKAKDSAKKIPIKGL